MVSPILSRVIGSEWAGLLHVWYSLCASFRKIRRKHSKHHVCRYSFRQCEWEIPFNTLKMLFTATMNSKEQLTPAYCLVHIADITVRIELCNLHDCSIQTVVGKDRIGVEPIIFRLSLWCFNLRFPIELGRNSIFLRLTDLIHSRPFKLRSTWFTTLPG